MTPFQPNDRPIANSYHPNDAKLTLATDGLSTDRHFILRNTAPSGVYDYIVVSFHRLSVLGKSPLLDTFIETNNSRLFENEALENLSELHFRRMLGVRRDNFLERFFIESHKFISSVSKLNFLNLRQKNPYGFV